MQGHRAQAGRTHRGSCAPEHIGVAKEPLESSDDGQGDGEASFQTRHTTGRRGSLLKTPISERSEKDGEQ